MQIETVDIESLKPYEKNAKQHPKEQIEQIKKSIEMYGNNDPIAVWGDDNIIVEGHGRYMALKELGATTAEIIRLDHLTDDQRREYALVHNKLTMNSDFDFDTLMSELEQLDFDGFDFGFDIDFDEAEETEIVEDEPPEPPEEPKAKVGDLYQLGNHRLICGNSTDPAVIDRLMDGVKADMVFTDPPYGYKYQSNWRTGLKKFEMLQNDDKVLDFFPSIKDIVNGFVWVCTTWKIADEWIELFKKYYDLTNVIIWDKGGGGIGDLFHTFSTDYEMILVCNNGQELRGKRYGSVWNFTDMEISKMKKEELLKIVLEQKEYYSVWKQKRENPNEYVHPTQKPVALPARAIRSSTDFDGVVLDCFGGSGSTLIACEQLNRRCYMAELDPKYVSVIVNRWLNLTGRKDEIFCIRDGQRLTYDEVFDG